MANYSKHLLSGSVGGRAINIGDLNTTPFAVVHETGVSDTVLDEIWLYANNTSSTAAKLTLQFGGVTLPNDLIELTIDAESGLVLVIPGLILTGDGTTGREVVAFTDIGAGGAINITGYVNRIS
jgi:hypothetical protein